MKLSLQTTIAALGFALMSLAILPVTSFGQTYAQTQITTSFGYGAHSADVVTLQNILISQGFLAAGNATGNYFTLTQAAVVKFQAAHGIQTTGSVGPLTRAALNKILVSQAPQAAPATVAVTSVKSNANTNALQAAAAFLSLTPQASTKTITWQTSGYPAGIGLNINLLRKVSDTPQSFQLVRTISVDTPNNGTFTWTPQASETGSNLYVEITCATDHQFDQGCQIASAPIAVQ